MWNEKLKILSRVFVRLKAVDTAGGATLYVEKSLSLVLPLVMDILLWISQHVQNANASTRSIVLEPHNVDCWGGIPNFSALLASVSLHRKTIGLILDAAVKSNVRVFLLPFVPVAFCDVCFWGVVYVSTRLR